MQFAQKDTTNNGKGWGLEHTSDAEAITIYRHATSTEK